MHLGCQGGLIETCGYQYNVDQGTELLVSATWRTEFGSRFDLMLRWLSMVLFFSLLAITSASVHIALAEQGAMIGGQTEGAVPFTEIEGARSIGKGTQPVARVAEARASASLDTKVDTGARDVLQGDVIENARGFWLTNPAGGKAALLERPPLPRLSALVPILMYHHVGTADRRSQDSLARDLTLPPAEFEKQLAHLSSRGFATITLQDLWLHLQGRKDLPERPVVLTFDDGYSDNYSYAFPLLKRYGYGGTFFAISGLIDQPGYLTWQQLEEMVAGGMEIGSHTVTHPDLARWLDAKGMEKELVESRVALESKLGVRVQALSYPSGSYNQQVISVAERAGYAVAVTTADGVEQRHDEEFEMSRVRVRGEDPLSVFKWTLDRYFPTGKPALK